MAAAKWIEDQRYFDRVAAEAVALARYAKGEHGESMSCPIKKLHNFKGAQ